MTAQLSSAQLARQSGVGRSYSARWVYRHGVVLHVRGRADGRRVLFIVDLTPSIEHVHTTTDARHTIHSLTHHRIRQTAQHSATCRRTSVLHGDTSLYITKQEAFEKCWAHSPLRAAARPFTRCRYCRTPHCRTPPAHICPRQRRRRQQRQCVTEGTAMAP